MDEIDGNNTDRGVGRSTSVVVRDSRKLETVLRSKSLSDLLGKGKEKEKALSSTLKPLKPLDSDPYVLLPPPIVSGALTSGAHEIDKSSIHSDSDIISEMCLNDRFSTVRRFPKPAFKRIEAISPLTEGTILLDIGSSSAQLPISSGILAPLKNASFLKVSNPVFHESQSPCPDNSDLYSFEFGEEQVTKRSPTSHLVTIKSPPLGKRS